MAQWFQLAVGGLGWSPGTFWRATIAELMMAIDGHNAANRVGPAPLTMAELDDLIEEYG